MAEISILIVNWNTRELLERVLKSIPPTAQFETIVVDNGSSDGSVEFVEKEFPKVILIKNKKNLGFAKAVNLGLQKSHGRAVMLLNSDAQLLPKTAETLFQVLFSEKKIGMVGAELIYEDGRLQNAIDHFPNLATELLNKSLLKLFFPKLYLGKRSHLQEPTVVPSLIGAGVMVKKEMIEDVGPLDEAYFFFLEETDWCYRMKKKGWQSVFVPGARLIHLQGQTARKHPWRSKIEFYRSRYTFFQKHYGTFSRILLLIGLLIKILIGLFFSLLGTLVSLGLWTKCRKRCFRYGALLVWHLLGCPKKMGLWVA